MSLSLPDSSIRFGRVTLLPGQRRVLVDDEPARLGGRAFDLLQTLLAHPGETVAKHELLETVWPGVVVEENNLQVQICTLRKLLGANAIVTVPGRGYTFSGSVDAGAMRDGRGTARMQGSAGMTPLRGRDDELALLSSVLRRQRIVTVVGPGGVGKSRLLDAALASGEQAATRIELETMPERASVAAWIAHGFELSGQRASSARQLASALSARAATLVIENAELRAQEVCEFAEALLDRAPGVQLVCTSQVPLKARGEHVLRLAPLQTPASDAAPDALQTPALLLLRDAVSTLRPHEDFTDKEAHDAVAISRHLDGIPLAIELAAARVPLLGMSGVRRMLAGDRFRLLSHAGRHAPAHQHSLLACMEWSWAILSARERAALSAVSRHHGRFTLGMARQAIGALAQSEWDAMELVGALVDKSLVLAESGTRSVFRVLETTRLFARQRAAQEAPGWPAPG